MYDMDQKAFAALLPKKLNIRYAVAEQIRAYRDNELRDLDNRDSPEKYFLKLVELRTGFRKSRHSQTLSKGAASKSDTYKDEYQQVVDDWATVSATPRGSLKFAQATFYYFFRYVNDSHYFVEIAKTVLRHDSELFVRMYYAKMGGKPGEKFQNILERFHAPDFKERFNEIWVETDPDAFAPKLNLEVIEGEVHFSQQTMKVLGREAEQEALRKFRGSGGAGFKWLQLAGAGGQGKSRLAFDLARKTNQLVEWSAGFLSDDHLEEFSVHVSAWQPTQPTLIIIDYVIGNEKLVRPIFRNLAKRTDEFSHSIRLLLVERQRWDRGGLVKINVPGAEPLLDGLGYEAAEGVASWFLALCDRKHDGADPLLSKTRFEEGNGVVELAELHTDILLEIVRKLAGDNLAVMSRSDGFLQTELSRLDDAGRPLYAYYFADALRHGEYQQGWTREELLEATMLRERERRWRHAFKNEPPEPGDQGLAMQLALLATIMGHYDNSNPLNPEGREKPTIEALREANALVDAPTGTRQTYKHVVPALKPDILGEHFVLSSLSGGFLNVEEIVGTALEVSPEMTIAFIDKCVQDFPHLPVTQKILDLVPNEYSWVFHQLAVRYHPADIKGSGNHFGATHYMKDTKWNFGKLASADNWSENEKKTERAVFWYDRAKQAGHLPSYYNLANLYWNGKVHDAYQNEAVQLYSEAADLGHAPSMEILADMYRLGVLVEPDHLIASELYRNAAEGGQVEAAYQLGLLANQNQGHYRGPEISFSYFNLAADGGHAGAEVELGWLYLYGEGIAQDSEEAVRYFDRAAKKKFSGALLGLAECYREGLGVTPNPFRGTALNRLASSWGSALATRNLGILYKDGIGVSPNPRRAVRYLRFAGHWLRDRQVFHLAQNDLAQCYFEGIGVRQNYMDGLLRKYLAASAGNPDALNMLGILDYSDITVGNGADRPLLDEFLHLLRQSAMHGSHQAMFGIGTLYSRGAFYGQCDKLAFRWYLASARRGNLEAKNFVSECFKEGRGVSASSFRAAIWAICADQSGNEQAKNLSNELRSKMSFSWGLAQSVSWVLRKKNRKLEQTAALQAEHFSHVMYEESRSKRTAMRNVEDENTITFFFGDVS